MNSEFKKIASETNKAGYQSSSLLLLIIVCLISAILYWAAVTELDKVIRGDGKTVSDLENQLIVKLFLFIILIIFSAFLIMF